MDHSLGFHPSLTQTSFGRLSLLVKKYCHWLGIGGPKIILKAQFSREDPMFQEF